MMKRAFVWLIALSLLTGMMVGFSVPASAEGGVYSGTVGKLTWELNDTTGVLTISGEGEMSGFSSSGTSATKAWLAYKSSIKTVVIEEGVTNVDSGAFQDCRELSAITLAESVVTIEDNAFERCTSLQEFVIPDQVTSLGRRLFSGCDALQKLTVEAGNPIYHSDKNCIIETAAKKIVAACNTSVIPDDGTVTALGQFAFYDCNLIEEMVIPETITVLDHCAFGECDSLKSIHIPKGVTNTTSIPFYRCASLESITVDPENPTYHSDGNCIVETATKMVVVGCKASVIPTDDSVTSVGRRAFCGCLGLTSITIPGNVITIEAMTFSDCDDLVDLFVGNGVQIIKGTAFSTNPKLKRAVLPSSLTSIGQGIFYECESLEIIYFLGSGTKWNSISKNSSWKQGTTGRLLYHPDHTWDEGVITIAPTHISEGEKTFTCGCGATKKSSVEMLTDHSHGDWIEHDAEQHKKECVCGDTQYEAHVWDDGEITTAPTHTQKGEKTISCEECGVTKTEPLEMLTEHIFGEWSVYSETQHKRECDCGELQYAEHVYENEFDATCNDCGRSRILTESNDADSESHEATAEESAEQSTEEETASEEGFMSLAGCESSMAVSGGLMLLLSLGTFGFLMKKKKD